MASLEITGGPGQVGPLMPGSSEMANYTVTNRSAGPINALLRPLPGGIADAGWLTVAGETTRLIEPGETTTVTLRFAVPPEAAAGEAQFGLRATNENDANNDWADSAMSTVQVGSAVPVPPPPTPTPMPAIPPSENKVPVWAILGGIALVLAIGVILVLLRDDSEPVPMPTPTATPTPSPTITPRPRPTLTPAPTITPVPIPTLTPLPVPTATPTFIPIPPIVFQNAFVGTWRNANTNTRATTRYEIAQQGNNLRIQGYGKCSPSDCVWPAVSVPLSEVDADGFNATIDHGFKRVNARFVLQGGRLRVRATHIYNDSRPTRTSDEMFNRQ
ncbi:hypothetical protein [Erythrobacter sp. THAF29]|uniref:COG1470 family protein n=1 Tax=Erythrobacter sp. THAF29 TaxID=2587851 RepID=UPI00126884ED|nr:hypothetical protein [Erythrobacter sp. THAF29]QFT76042.1 hypothetical protein FIU90_00670 [Erythrobacter sp. THAF29]